MPLFHLGVSVRDDSESAVRALAEELNEMYKNITQPNRTQSKPKRTEPNQQMYARDTFPPRQLERLYLKLGMAPVAHAKMLCPLLF